MAFTSTSHVTEKANRQAVPLEGILFKAGYPTIP